MRISMSFSPGGDLAAFAAQLPDLERAGLDMLFMGEAYGYDAPTILGYLAAHTHRVQIGPSVLSVFSRSPAVLAMTAAGLDYVSGGRAILGLGTSGPQVIEGWHGVPYEHPIQRTREVIEICRQVWRGERVEHQGLLPVPLPPDQGMGMGKPLKIVNRPVRDRIPIHIASLGPKNVELTAEVAEGWVPVLYLPEKAKEVWGDSLKRGLARRPADLGPLEVIAGGPVAIGDNVEHLRERARPNVTFYVGGMGAKGTNFYNDLARRYGYEAEAEKIQDLYLAGQRDAAAAAVPTEFLEKTSLIGPAPYIKERLAAYKESGVTVLSVQPMEDPVRTIARLKEWMA